MNTIMESGKNLRTDQTKSTIKFLAFGRGKRSVDSTNYLGSQTKLKMNNTSKRNINMSSSFSLYGQNSTTSGPDWAKMANIEHINAADAANKFYDKNIIRALDKFT